MTALPGTATTPTGHGHARTLTPAQLHVAGGLPDLVRGRGYAPLQFGGWPAGRAILVGLVAGLPAGAFLIALFLGRVMAGERVMDARRYRLPARWPGSRSASAQGVGEIVFVKEGVRRSEARGAQGRPIARDAQVVILEYGKGVAASAAVRGAARMGGQPDHATEPGRASRRPKLSPSGV